MSPSLCAPIVGLLTPSRPPTVAGFVISIVVDAIESQFRRSFAHVGEEVVKEMPSLTHIDASPAVMLEVLVCGIAASIEHAGPRFIGSGHLASAIMAMTDTMGLRENFEMSAAAAYRCAAAKLVRHGDGFVSAVALTNPIRPRAPWPRRNVPSQYDKARETLAGDIVESGHAASVKGSRVKRRSCVGAQDRLATIAEAS